MFDESGESGCSFMFVFWVDHGSVPFMDKYSAKKTYQSRIPLTDLPISSMLEIRVLVNIPGMISQYMFWLQRSVSKLPVSRSH